MPADRPPLNMHAKAKVPASAWGPGPCEDDRVLIRQNNFLLGVLDKSQVCVCVCMGAHACVVYMENS